MSWTNIAKKTDADSLIAYLLRAGWTERRKDERRISYVTCPPNLIAEEFTIVVPISSSLADYGEMMERAIRAISLVMDQTPQDILAQSAYKCDVFKTSVDSFRTQKGSIPLEHLNVVLDCIRRLTIFSTCSELAPKPHYRRRLKAATQVADKCLFGQTQLGSFVTSIYLPLSPITSEQLELFDEPLPIERRVVERIMRGLTHIVEATSSQSIKPIIENTDIGLNANMCDAVADLIYGLHGSVTYFQCAFDPAFEAPDAWSFDPIVIAPESLEAVRQAADVLRGTDELEEVEMTAYIYQLRHERDSERVIRLEWRRGRDVFRVNAVLGEADYDRACDAHKRERPVRLRGTLKRAGRGWSLMKARELIIAEAGDPEA